MWPQPIRKTNAWLRYAFAIGVAFAVILIAWQARRDWVEWKVYRQVKAYAGGHGPHTLVWKQAILPTQYIQASCGACHREGLPQTPRLNHGRKLLVEFNCIGCHRLQDIDRPDMLGPDLSSVGTKVSREWIYKWLKEPRTLNDADGNVIVDGVLTRPRMPQFRLNEEELRALSAYLSVQRAQSVEHYSLNPKIVASLTRQGDAADQGKTRFNQMFCVTCHALAVDRGGETSLIGGDIGPELTKVGSKVNPEWLTAWLRNPQNYLQHTKMPQYRWSDKDLYEVTQYILKRLVDPDLLKDVPRLDSPSVEEIQSGRRLFVAKGCAECHAIRGVTAESDFGPDLSAFAMTPHPHRITMNSHDRNAIPWHFANGDISRLDVTVSSVPRFMISFIHAKVTNPTSVTPETNMPAFHMSQSDLEDLTTALLSMVGSSDRHTAEDSPIIPRAKAEFHPAAPFEALYRRYKCEVCHAFNGYGGTLAPDLSYEGSRAQPEWLIQFLENPQTLRPVLTVRMPEFNMSEQDATTIANYISSSLRNPKMLPVTGAGEAAAQMAERGKQLYEQKYQCQSCHTIGSSGGYVGPSLNNAGNWLTPAWIAAWLRNPQALVPGTIEPHQPFTDDEVKELAAYIATLKQSSAMESARP